MVLRMRLILPYALPGVLALVGCWWFFSRKKEGHNKKRKHLVSPAELQADDVLKGLVPKNVLQTSSRVQPAQINGEACASQDSLTCSLPSTEQLTPLFETQSDCKAEDTLKSEYPTQNVLLDALQGSSHQEITEAITFRIQTGDGDVCTPTAVHNVNKETHKILVCDLGLCSGDVAEVCTTSLCDHVQANEPTDKSEKALIGSCAEYLLSHSEPRVCSAETHKALPSFDVGESVLQQTNHIQSNATYNFRPPETYSEAFKNNTSEEYYVDSFIESGVQPCIDEIETVVEMSILVQCPPSVANETGETEHASAQSPECNRAEQIACSEPPNLNLFPPMEAGSEPRNSAICGVTGNVLPAADKLCSSPIKTSSMEMVGVGNCPDLLDTICQSLEKNEQLETTSSLMDWNHKAFCKNCDTKTPSALHNSRKESNNIMVCDFALGSEDTDKLCKRPCDTVQTLGPDVTSLNQTHLVKEEVFCCDVTASTTKSEIQQNKAICDFRPTVACSEVEALKTIQSEELHIVPSTEQSVQACVGEIEAVVKMSLLLQCPQSVANETELMSTEKADHCSFRSSEYCRAEQVALSKPKSDQWSPMEAEICEIRGNVLPTSDVLSTSCVKPSSEEILSEGKCTDILDAFSQCLGKNDQLETTGSAVACLGEGKANTFLGNLEAKIVEQLAMNIISKVIVAAKQEILSGSTSDMSGTCQVLVEKNGQILQKESQSLRTALDENKTNASGNVTEINATCEYTQTEQSQVKDFRNTEVKDDSCLELQKQSAQTIPNIANATQSLSNFSPVHQSADFFDESQAAMEDSSISVCTSEDGISMEDQLQSTVLSNVGVGSYDSLSSSGIELSTENVNVFRERPKKVGEVENKTISSSNGEVKKCPADMKKEGPWTGDTEADHSGGSDVNSMDSVDSGYALGKSEEAQDVNQKNGAKRTEFIIWEFEVPKHLVGRLIGKQGRFVSFLKESSGAKIYICTVPYTQDYQMCHLEGAQQQIDRALFLIGKKFKELNLTNIFAPPPSMALHSLPMTSWLMLPDGVTVEVIVVNVVNAGHMFVQQHTHPTFHALRGLDQQMFLCYSQSGIPTLPTPVEVGVICAAPMGDNAWWRAQVVAYYCDSEEVEIRYVDYGGYERVKIEILRQIRSDFVSLPFQGAEVLLDNVIPLTDEDHFSTEADVAANEMTRGTALLAQVTNYDGATGLPLVQLWSMMADEVVSINRTLVERGFAQWIDGY